MPEERAICTLDYLIGTLATAYKGIITSLIIKDFCMIEREGSMIFKGTIFSIPEGDYQASLIHEGIEIYRGNLHEGYFELRSDSRLIEEAKNLQIDIIQNGRHIGTFLLKRERKEGVFTSALELSEEIKDINFGLLTHPLSGKVGLLKKAEDIIAAILSTKQNPKRLSEQLNSFSKDLFWFDRKTYYLWFDVLVRWSLNASSRIENDAKSKAVSNVLSLIELPLESESDRESLHYIVAVWLKKLVESPVDLSAGLNHSRRMLSRIYETFPDVDVGQVLRVLLGSLNDRVEKTPALSEDVMKTIKNAVSHDDYQILRDYSETTKNELLASLSRLGFSLDEKDYAKIFEVLDLADSWLSKDKDMITVFFDTAERNLTQDSAGPLSEAFMGLFAIFDTLPSDIYRNAISNAVRLMKKLTDLGRFDLCDTFLRRIEKHDDPLRSDIILNTGTASAILDSGEESLLGIYNGMLEQILIPAPKISGFSRETWAEVADPLHLERLSKLMDILKLGDRVKETLIRVICNIFVGGVFIPDDRIFQREVSKYLNSGTMKDNFLLHYMLLKKLPVYYHEVGATGRLRDDTTEIDSWGNDPVLYFIRKQVHVNSSNYLIHVIEEVMKAWLYDDPEILQGSVPEEILKSLSPGLLQRYSSVVRSFFESSGILDAEGFHFEKVMEMPDSEIGQMLASLTSSEEIRLKILLICRIYRELVKKYSLLPGKIEKEDIVSEIVASVNKLRELKEVILSPEKTQAEEALYFKRHIAFGIPSVMGSYHEPKFDAFAESLEIEERLRTLFNIVIADIRNRGNEFSEHDAGQWIVCIGAIEDILQLRDLGNFQIDEIVTVLKENNFHLSQIIDLLRMCQKEMTRAVEFFTKTFHGPLIDILENFSKDGLPDYLRGLEPAGSDFTGKATDIVMRAIMGSVAGFFEHDVLIDSFVDALNDRIRSGPDELLNLSDNPRRAEEYYTIDGLSDEDAMRFSPRLGNKAKNLVYLHNKGLMVPWGVVFPADRTHDYREYTESDGFRTALHQAVREIESKTGYVFGGKKCPLFLSVRSGSYISMPGILSSILYCGMNDETAQALIDETGNPWFAWDSYRRFIEHYGTVVHDLDRDLFEGVADDYLKEYGVGKKEELSAGQMQEIVQFHLAKLGQMNRKIPDDVYEQLKESVKAVYRSWYSERSVQFRRAVAISDHWGTAVTLMQMIPGNDRGGGASVFFTRKPFSLDQGIYGDTKEMATGGELVYGRSVNRPITRQQALNGQTSLEEIDPELFRMHEDLARSIERAMRGLPQEVEATYVKTPNGKRVIYVLQTRNMEFYRGFTRTFDDVCHMESNVVGRGVGVHGGALSGVATFASSPETLRELRKKSNLPVILLRREASTNDVSLMTEINGILTAAGGATSHAAVLAQKFRLTAIVGCSDMKIERDEKKEFFARIATLIVREGDFISIDGSTGLVYSGLCFSAAEV